MRFLKWLGLALGFVLLVSGTGFVWWANDTLPPMPEAIAALQSDAQVQVQTQPWLIFTPTAKTPTTGFIFYPGGKADARAYAPMAHAIAARGYLVVIVPMPLNLAFFGGDRAAEVMRAYPTIKRWAIGGHSLGGVAASGFAKNHPDQIAGLVLLASYPADFDSLSSSQLVVTSIAGTRDALSTPEKIAASRALLPLRTRYVAIEGGNHSQMGWYGAQPGDNPATITREEQQSQIVAAVLALLEQIRA